MARKPGNLNPDGRGGFGSITPGSNPYNPARVAVNKASGVGKIASDLLLIGGATAIAAVANDTISKADKVLEEVKYKQGALLSTLKSRRGQTRGR